MPDAPGSIESYLPKMSEKPSLAMLLDGYGKYWMSQPSLSGYQRHYSLSPSHPSTSPRNLIVWEGYPGHYDAYGDFEDDDVFYNESVKAYYIFWHLGQGTEGSVHVWGTDLGKLLAFPLEQRSLLAFNVVAGDDPHGIGFDDVYPSLAALREAMITKWTKMQPTLGEQGEYWHNFIKKHQPNVVTLLKEFGQAWADENRTEARHSLVYPIENYVFLVRWTGELDAVQVPTEYDHKREGHPKITWKKVNKLNIFRVALKRLRIRFSLEQPYNLKSPNIQYSYVDGASSLKIFEELRSTLKEKLPEMKLV